MTDTITTHYEQTKRSLDARFQCTGYAERTWKASSQRRVRWTFETYATRDGAIVLGTKDILIRYHYEQIPYVTNPRASGLARVPRGCVVAVRTAGLDGEPTTIRFGWSWCRRDEQFRRKVAVRIAYYRAFALLGSLAFEGAKQNAPLPVPLRPLHERVVEIAERRWLGKARPSTLRRIAPWLFGKPTYIWHFGEPGSEK